MFQTSVSQRVLWLNVEWLAGLYSPILFGSWHCIELRFNDTFAHHSRHNISQAFEMMINDADDVDDNVCECVSKIKADEDSLRIRNNPGKWRNDVT